MSDLPIIRWGIIATGLISSWFVEDALLKRPEAKVNTVIQAIGSSKLEKGEEFAKKYCPEQKPHIYDTYEGVYNDPDVDVVYIGTPHGYHYRDCLNAIAAGKNVLCEKAFTVNTEQAKEIFEAARAKNVYVAEAMWLRHRPLYQELRRLLHQERIIGDVVRVFGDFAVEIDIPTLQSTSRYKDLTLGAGSLLDIGIYALTWVTLALESGDPGHTEMPFISASQTHEEGIEIVSSAILQYPSTGRQGIATSTTKAQGPPGEVFSVIHGTNGHIEVQGRTPSAPESFTVWKKLPGGDADRCLYPREAAHGKKYDFPPVGRGFTWEAENTALDVLEGRKESRIMPWAETIHMMEIMDEIRSQGDTVYPGE